jgi:gliding motility-associated-like protein
MTTPGAYQTTYRGGGYDVFISKFDGCTPILPPNTTSNSALTICKGDSTILTTSSLCDVKWYNVPIGGSPISNTSVFHTPELSTDTTFYVSEGSCGSNTVRTAITITVNTLPLISIELSNKILCYNSEVNAKALGAISYTWYPEKWISCSNCSNPLLSPLETIEYCIEGQDNNGCKGKTCTTIEVNFAQDHNFSLPNAFTPNNDGINDSFCLQGWDLCIEAFLIRVFDRWGEKVFESEDPNFCWNGIYKGQLLSADVFVYSVSAKYKDDTKINKKGNITLIR